MRINRGKFSRPPNEHRLQSAINLLFGHAMRFKISPRAQRAAVSRRTADFNDVSVRSNELFKRKNQQKNGINFCNFTSSRKRREPLPLHDLFYRTGFVRDSFEHLFQGSTNFFYSAARSCRVLHLFFSRFNMFNILGKISGYPPILISGQSKRPCLTRLNNATTCQRTLMMWNLTRGVKFKKLHNEEVKF